MIETRARLDRTDDARHRDTAADARTDAVRTAADVSAIAAADWDSWAARVDGERDIAVVLDAMPRAHASVGAYAAGPQHPLAPVDGVLTAPRGVVGPFARSDRPAGQARPRGGGGRSGLGTGSGFVRLNGHREPTGVGRLRLAMFVAAALWCASNAAMLADALTG
ncbi:MAG: hypothetical protein ACRCYX_15700 [Dermatophilaceae bacterium]